MKLKSVKMAAVAVMTLMSANSFANTFYCQDQAIEAAKQDLYKWAMVGDSSPKPISQIVEITDVRRIGLYANETVEEFYVSANVHSGGRSPLRTGVQVLMKTTEQCRRLGN